MRGWLLVDTGGTDGVLCLSASEIDMDNLPTVKAAWRKIGGRVLAIIRPKLDSRKPSYVPTWAIS